jgi:nitroreductase
MRQSSPSRPQVEEKTNMSMDVFDAIRRRRAVRSYSATPVDEETVRALLDAAIRAPSAGNLQPWSFVIIQDRQRLRGISDDAKRSLRHDPHWKDALPLADLGFDIFHGAGTLIVICARQDGFAPLGDCYLAGENLMLAACALGLATCPIGLARDIFQQDPVRAALHIPVGEQPVLPIVVGHPVGSTPATERAPPRIHAWLNGTGPGANG